MWRSCSRDKNLQLEDPTRSPAATLVSLSANLVHSQQTQYTILTITVLYAGEVESYLLIYEV